MKVYISQQRGKKPLVDEFGKYAEVTSTLTDDVDLIIPTVDEELPFFASAKDYFLGKGTIVPIPSNYTVDICRDKAEFYRFCRRHGFNTPTTMQEVLIAKPRFGKASRGLIKIDRSYIVQYFIENMPEVSVDYFADMEGNYLSIIPRYRKNVVNGESQDFELVRGMEVEEIKRLGKELGLVGHNVIQGFYDEKVNSFCFTEVNCRFGGGSHFTWPYFNSVKWLINYCERIKCSNAKNVVVTSKELKSLNETRKPIGPS